MPLSAPEPGPVVVTGVQALVRLPVERHLLDAAQGLRTATLVSGYPGSPLGGYDLELARAAAELAEHDVVHRPAVNEEIAATAVWGSQVVGTIPGARYNGVVGLWYGKAPGLDRSSDAIRHANLSGVSSTGGALALVGDDAVAKSSTVPSASEATLAALRLPVLCPGDVQDVLDLGVHGVALSRSCGLWVGMKLATSVADAVATVDRDLGRVETVAVGIELDGRPFEQVPTMQMIGTRLEALEYSLANGRLEAARAYGRANALNRIVQSTVDDRLGIAAAGKTYCDVVQALRDLGLESEDLARLGIRLLQIRMPYPLDGATVREFARGLSEIVVVEEKQPFLELLVKDELYNVSDRPLVVGKRDMDGRPLVKSDGELSSDAIARILADRMLALGDAPSVRARLERLQALPVIRAPATARAPYFCSGCPHNTSVATVPDGALVSAGIGCHGMATLMRPEEVGDVTGLTQMGGEGAQWIGMAPFTERRHLFQNLGDGTFQHSGSLAVRASVAAGTNITYKLLWNAHIAMTGGQVSASGLTVERVAGWLLAEGVRRVIVTTEDPARWAAVDLPAGVEVWHRDRILEAQEALARIDGVTVLVHDQECAAELRRRRKRGTAPVPPMRVLINERVCEGCGDCGHKSNCLSVHPVETEFGRKTQIHQSSCNEDYSCLKGDCPAFITLLPGNGAAAERSRVEPLAAETIPEPAARATVDGEFGLRITGVGGSGVVTVARTLATAAQLDGLSVRGLDQTGLAQKGGVVVSDVTLLSSPAAGAGRLATAGCDLYVAADVVAGSIPAQLDAADPARTIAVISTTRIPTGLEVVDAGAGLSDPGGLAERILDRCVRERSVLFDAAELAERLFGNEVVANMLLVGAAYQAAALPLAAASIEHAIGLNGASVDLNVQAFRRGRQLVADPDALELAIEGAASGPPAAAPSRRAKAIAARVRARPRSELERSVAVRVAELIAYQNARYATAYAGDVERVRTVESERAPGMTGLSEAVAFSLHKLMAYKDEYEVARLHLDPQLRREAEALCGPGAALSWQLHPPTLRALGLDHKIALGERVVPAFRLLVAMRRLRGTRADPFGRARVRRVERALIVEYRALLDHVLSRLDADNHALAVELASLPDLVRGYEDIKLASVERYHAQVAVLRARFDAAATPATVAAGSG